jgi:hypothetical protein
MHIFDDFTGETVTVIKGGQFFAVNDKPGAVLELWPVTNKAEKLKSWHDRPAVAKRAAAIRAAGWHFETVPAGRGIIAAIAFRADNIKRARIYRRAALAAVHGMESTNPA